MERCLFIFRRDLRLEHNFAFAQIKKKTIACFIFTPEQIEHNPYRSDRALQFMIESLIDLEMQIKKHGGRLTYFYGHPHEVVKKCIENLAITEVVFNRDYTPYSRKRDQQIEEVCQKYGVTCSPYDDLLLNAPEKTLKKEGTPYTIFTPYFKNALKMEIEPLHIGPLAALDSKQIEFENGRQFLTQFSPLKNDLKGGRTEALKRLHQAHISPTHCSAYLKFGCISPKEAYHAWKDTDLMRSLYWRDFFSHIGYFFPHVFGGAFHKKYDNLKWHSNEKNFHAWCEGKTGFPIVDAGMRQLNETGLMDNRARMIVASFLTKDLHIDWRLGEKYFAQKLIDYDPAVNNGNWQWAASTGCDAAPYFRIFNPWAQQKKFDPECLYIKKWVPELKRFSPKEIHDRLASSPILDHAIEAKAALKRYKEI